MLDKHKNNKCKMINQSKNFNVNYAAQIIEVKNLRPVPNADRLLMFTYEGMNIITSNQTKEGDVVIYFPVECKINKDFLRLNNQFRKPELNLDPSNKGFFEETGRVKALKLRGQPSEGFIMPLTSINVLSGVDWTLLTKSMYTPFDTVGNHLLVEKYRIVRQQATSEKKDRNKGLKGKLLESKLVDEQFKFHKDTPKLAQNIWKLNTNDIISLTWKMHGTSFVSSRVLCKRKLTKFEKVLKWLGIKINDLEYDNVYSSRKVIKNEYLNPNANHYYKTDIWGEANNILKNSLLKGETVYGEIVGFTKDGAYIQNGYDYNCPHNTFKIYVYRITHTNFDGKVIELPYHLMKERVSQFDSIVQPVPLIYYGKAVDLYNELYDETNILDDFDDSGEKWTEYLFDWIKSTYVYDQDSQFCINTVPEEGVVLKVESYKPEAYKLKSSKFLRWESKALDDNIIDIEAEQDV